MRRLPSDEMKRYQIGIVRAIEGGDAELVRVILESGIVHINAVLQNTGETFLHVAVRKRQEEIIEYLLRRGIDAHRRDNIGMQAMEIAIDTGDVRIQHRLKTWIEDGV